LGSRHPSRSHSRHQWRSRSQRHGPGTNRARTACGASIRRRRREIVGWRKERRRLGLRTRCMSPHPPSVPVTPTRTSQLGLPVDAWVLQRPWWRDAAFLVALR
jgi:hypothetical protein